MKTPLRLASLCASFVLFACASNGAESQTEPSDAETSPSSESDTAALEDVERAEQASDTQDIPEDSDGPFEGDATSMEEVMAPGPCESTRRPIVAAHGFIASGDTWAAHAQRFVANGYCWEDIVAFDWNSVSAFTGSSDASVPELSALIDTVLAERGADQVDLIGHSAGGGIAYTYLDDPANAAKVAHYAHVGSFPSEGPAGPEGEVPTLNVWSEGDLAIENKADIPGATNLKQVDADHYGVATNLATFEAIFAHFNEGELATVLEVPTEETPTIWGRAVTFGENIPIQGEMALYALDAATGARVGDPLAALSVPASGDWGPYDVVGGQPYELTIQQAGNRPVHYYTEPFQRSNGLVYLRGFPGANSMVGFLLAGLPFDDAQSMLVVFSSSRALTHGNDSLMIDGVEVLSPQTAAPENSSIAFFLYDADEDGESSLESIALFESFPFLVGIDMGLPASPDGHVTVTLNGRSVVVPAWPSDTEGASVVVFN